MRQGTVLVVGAEAERLKRVSDRSGSTVSALADAAAVADLLWEGGEGVVEVRLDRALAGDRDVVELIGLCERDWPGIRFVWFDADQAEAFGDDSGNLSA